jgi:hypothetical protein
MQKADSKNNGRVMGRWGDKRIFESGLRNAECGVKILPKRSARGAALPTTPRLRGLNVP